MTPPFPSTHPWSPDLYSTVAADTTATVGCSDLCCFHSELCKTACWALQLQRVSRVLVRECPFPSRAEPEQKKQEQVELAIKCCKQNHVYQVLYPDPAPLGTEMRV